MNAIGGYLELELNDFGTVYHDKAIALNNGRNALKFILMHQNVEKVYLPFYSCDVLEEPLKELRIPYSFYELTVDLLPNINGLKETEVLLYINYFGVCSEQVEWVIHKFETVIIDNAQAFFSQPHKDIPTFYSCRKFFGVPDGGFVYFDKTAYKELPIDESSNRVRHLSLRIENGAETGYPFFKENEENHSKWPLMQMSRFTTRLLRNIDYEKVVEKRNQNFRYLHEQLGSSNIFPFKQNIQIINGPLVYPYLCESNVTLRKMLLDHKIFVPTYWPNIVNRLVPNSFIERNLILNLLALPIDQNMSTNDLDKLIKNIKNNGK